ncbi:MAG: MCE family protein [Actinobacteria bacterium]|nr:MCE family protein [Actinomycetota bacterium]
MDTTLVRRVVGTALAVLLVGGGRLVAEHVTTVPGAYEVEVQLGEAAGSGLGAGSHVKLRGVRIGRVVALQLRDGLPVATLELEPEPAVPTDVRPVVTAKTLLGEKQIELRPDGPLVAPFLRDGDHLAVADGTAPTEVDAVVAELDRLLSDLDADRLAALVAALGGLDEDDAATLGRNLDAVEELAAFGARTAGDQVARVAALADVVEAVADRADDLDRVAAALPDAVGVVADREADLAAAAVALDRFSVGLAELLEHERPRIRRLFGLSDTIGAVIDPRMAEIGRMIHGIYRYALVFGQHGGSLDDGSEHAWFRAFIGEEGSIARLCQGLPPELREVAPGCARPPADRQPPR